MRNINLAPQPKPYMPYGYYTPLMGLEDKPKTKKQVDQHQFEAHKGPEASDLTQAKQPTQNNSLFSLRTAKTALKYTLLTVSALATGVFIYNLAQNPGGLPPSPPSPGGDTFDTPCFPNETYSNQSAAVALGTGFNFNPLQGQVAAVQTLALQGVGAALLKTATDLSNAVRDPNTALGSAREVAGQAYGAGLALASQVKASAIAKYYGFNEELEQVPVTEHDQQVLDIRAKHPSYFSTSFISRALANGRSAIGKVIALAAAKGEASTPFAQYASFSTTSSAKYTLGDIDSPEKIEAILGKKMTKEEFIKEKEKYFVGYNEGEYEAYSRGYDSRATSYNKIKSQVNPQTFADLEAAHFREAGATSEYVKRKYMYLTPNAPKEANEVAFYHGGAKPKQSVWRTEYGRSDVAHDSRKANFQVDEMSSGDILVSRNVWDTESTGEGNSSWDKFTLGCSYHPEHEEVHCTNENLGHIDHAFGEVKYQVREKMVSDSCSLIQESFESPLLNKQYTYAINPKKNLPIMLSQFVDSERFLTKKVKSFWASLTGNVDAIVAFSPKLPKGLPSNCDELAELENPKPKLAASAESTAEAAQMLLGGK